MVIGAYRELFTAIAASAGALTGLLFVAVSVVPRRGGVSGLDVIQQVRAAAALLAFTNALAISLFGLVPGTNAGYPAAVLGIIGILFTAAGTRSILSSRSTRRQQSQQLELIILLLLIFGAELASRALPDDLGDTARADVPAAGSSIRPVKLPSRDRSRPASDFRSG